VRTLNLGVVAHVDAGKTSLTERLLYAAGVIEEMGSVDDGNTQTDSLALERRRGITIRSAVVSFVVDDVTVNLIDTPGHPDFIAEVDRVLGVLDGAVLVVSAVEGVQAQTGIVMRALQRLRVPTLLFVNKLDRVGARPDQVVVELAERLTPAVVPLAATRGAGTPGARAVPLGGADAAHRDRLTEVLADLDDTLLDAYVAGADLPYDRLRRALADQTRRARAHPVWFGSATTGAGVDLLTASITSLLPAAAGDRDGPLSGSVFKVERGVAGDKVAYARLFSGVLRTRDRLRLGDGEHTVTAIDVFDRGPARRAPSVTGGQIAKLRGLAGVRVGDTIGTPRPTAPGRHFSPPTLEAVIVPLSPRRKGALHAALVQLAEQDPLIALRQDDARGELFVSLYGEVQQEVLRATLADDYGIDVEFRETTTLCIERPIATGRALEVRGRGRNPFAATVGLRIEPGLVGSGVTVRSEVEAGSIPVAYPGAVEEKARETLREGLHGWQVSDCVVTITHCDHRPPPVPVGGFRSLTPLVAMAALERAGTVVCEPINRFRLDLPADSVAAARAVLARLDAVPHEQAARGTTATLEGEIRAAHVHRLQQQLPEATAGRGVLESTFAAHRPVAGRVPTRPRSLPDPRHREEYLLHLTRRVQP
jgi:ribosomal protection tetracycline resistance protein